MNLQSQFNLETPRYNGSERVIHFDGGTSCNIPRLGYGIGYGSYRIDRGPVIRVNHEVPMSANAAEIFTLVSALKEVEAGAALVIIGDSQIALKWVDVATGKRKATKILGTSPEFQKAIADLTLALRGFKSVQAVWKDRSHAVAAFGH